MTSTTLVMSAALAAIAMLGMAPAFAQTPGGPASQKLDGYSVGAPRTHDNLTVYLIRGPSAEGPAPLILSEALAKKLFRVHETGQVNELMIENLGTEPVFLQAGDIVKGGQQDRVLTTSLLVSGQSGRVPIGAYCVEQGRWSARGIESVKTFESSAAAMPSRKAKAAMMAAAAPQPPRPSADQGLAAQSMFPGRVGLTGGIQSRTTEPVGPDAQTEVWRSVAETQSRLASTLGGPIASKESATSLQLALENEKLARAKAAYLEALSAAGHDANDVVGVAFAVNGEISSADIYPSHALFAKMWTKLMDAAATEALTEKSAGAVKAAPDPATVRAFLEKPAAAAPQVHDVDQNITRSIRRAAGAIAMEAATRDGRMVHRSYVSY